MDLLSLIPTVGKIIEKIIPDKAAAAEAKLKLLELQQSGELARLTAETELAKGQLAINAEEAKNANLFVSGWRPSVGWVCSLALVYQFFLRPALVTFGHPAPELPMGDLITILLGLLGLGTLRTVEKVKGVAAK
jgi:hypothetical protein